MQIGSYNPLSFLPGSAPATGKTDDAEARAAAKAAADAAATTGDAGAVPEATSEQDAAGVVLKLQADAAASSKDLVYGNGRKAATAGSGDAISDADTAAMALRHSQALERSAGSSTKLSVDSNGVLLAKPVSAGEAKAQAFVNNAVTAMRDHADAQERQKADGQKLMARFKLFS